MDRIKIAVIGGSGFWSEQNHHKNILELKSKFQVELRIIVDFVDPWGMKKYKNLQRLLKIDKPSWLNPRNFSGEEHLVKILHRDYKIDLVIIASNPCSHFLYGIACIRYGLNVICDKPIVSSYNASTNLSAARSIRKNYFKLCRAYESAKKKWPRLLFHSILRRRSLPAFMGVASELEKVQRKYRAGINNMTILVNGGVNKFPAEFTAGGAHGYFDGIGSLSHSAYHYIDVISWFLSCAPGDTREIIVKLNYVTRIKDYLDARIYRHIAKIIKTDRCSTIVADLSKNILGCELNSGFTFSMFNQQGYSVGKISLLYNYVSFTPRVNVYDEFVKEPANYKGGGRMSNSFIDIHQGGLQNWQIIKNNVVFSSNNIDVRGRRHPFVTGRNFESFRYKNAYKSGGNLKAIFNDVLAYLTGNKDLMSRFVVRGLPEERLATELYGACYELIASDFINKSNYSPRVHMYYE